MVKPRSEMTQEELTKMEQEEFSVGPLSILTQSVKNNTQVFIVASTISYFIEETSFSFRVYLI